ncbi:MAG: hypothetical protein FJ301_02570 [Planctomycetes bacterium]|nr:hypothetical protein [Planctomycetota bacterium]
MNTTSIRVRSAHLAVVAAVRHAGVAPWLLVVGWGLFAALQEPMLFRSYGIRLPFQAAWPACIALLAVLAASCPKPRHGTSQVLAVYWLTASIASVLTAVLAAVEGARGSLDGLRLAGGWCVGCLLVATPFGLLLLATRGQPVALRAIFLAAALALALSLAVRFDSDPWSLRTIAATLCFGLAAVARACNPPRPHAHRHPR